MIFWAIKRVFVLVNVRRVQWPFSSSIKNICRWPLTFTTSIPQKFLDIFLSTRWLLKITTFRPPENKSSHTQNQSTKIFIKLSINSLVYSQAFLVLVNNRDDSHTLKMLSCALEIAMHLRMIYEWFRVQSSDLTTVKKCFVNGKTNGNA